MEPKTREGKAPWLEASLLLLISAVITLRYSATGGNPLFWDEYYHLLAARSWAETGTLAVGEGVYPRAAWFSVLVGWVFGIFGESVFTARLPGAVTLTLWVLAMFLWVRSVAGQAAAWIASLAFCLSPVVLINGVMVRFYGIAGLLFWIGCAGAFFALSRGRPLAHRIVLALGSLALLDLAHYASSLSRLYIACLALWVAGALAVGWKDTRRNRAFLAAAAALLIVGVSWAIGSGWFHVHWAFYQRAPLWAMERGTDVQWYEGLLKGEYPTLWTLLPVAAILSVARQPALGTMAVVIFGGGFLLLSLGGAKAERFILPIMPFFFVLWGIAAAELVPPLRRRVSTILSLVPVRREFSRIRALGENALLLLALAFVLVMNPAFARVGDVLSHQAGSLDRLPQGAGASPEAWEQVADFLRPLMDEVDVVITANSVQSLYHLGDYDFAMRPTVIEEISPPEDFGLDLRTGRPAISTLESLRQVVEGHLSGLVFGESWRWRHPVEGFTEEVTDYIETNMEAVPIPRSLGVRAYRW
jgi:hypothetical protein